MNQSLTPGSAQQNVIISIEFYVIAAPPGIEKGKVWHSEKVKYSINGRGAQHLIGKHDFTSFRTINCQAKSPIRTLDKISLSCVGDEIIINVSAKSFYIVR